MGKKYYAIKNGKKTGIFTDWEETKKHVQGYSNAIYKSFGSLEDAKKYLGENIELKKNIQQDGRSDVHVVQAYIDGSFSEEKNIYSFGAVLINKNEVIAELYDSENNNNLTSMRNVAGELLGAMVAIKWAYENNYEKIEVFYDYFGIERWANGDWKAKKDGTKKYVEFIESYKNKIDIAFTKVKAHTGVVYNERADKLAARAISEDSIDKVINNVTDVVDERLEIFYNIMNSYKRNEKEVKSNIRFNNLDIDAKKLDTFLKRCWKLDGFKISEIKSKFIELNIDRKMLIWSVIDKDGLNHDFELKL